MNDRYSRQEAFYGIGKEGQQKLLGSRAAIVGAGALGTVSSVNLARAGVGFIRIIDRDYVELSNLQRQVLYTEKDAAEAVPKAAAAAEHLREVNSEIEIEPEISDLNSGNADRLLGDVDVVIDATDNLETRMLMNEACDHCGIPWIYGGVLGSSGMTMTFFPGPDAPCLRCVIEDGPDTSGENCSTAGVLNTMTSIIASLQCTDALKILTGHSDQVRRSMLFIDLWENRFVEMKVKKLEDCPVCGRHEYHYYGHTAGTQAVSLCGRDSVQIVPAGEHTVDFEELAARLAPLGDVRTGRFTLDFTRGGLSLKMFRDGRGIVKGTSDTGRAKSFYSEYIGI